MNKTVSILGSTGSIGTQSLEVCEKHGLKVTALAAHSSIDLLEAQARKFSPKVVCIYSEDKYAQLRERLADTDIKVLCGMDGLCEIAAMQETDIVLNSVVGMVGLLPTLEAAKAGNDIALANKETLVAGGKLVTETAAANGVEILPVDSEHSAVFQCLCAQGAASPSAPADSSRVRRILLTASGGPFFGMKRDALARVTPEQALAHPTWKMGKKITIDSATMMNKGFEVMEASWLFGVPADMIDVVVHRESILHSAVKFVDGSVIAQMGNADMRLPIQYAVEYPERTVNPFETLDIFSLGSLSFFRPDRHNFPALALCEEASNMGAVINGANEVAVAAFLDGRIGFLDIYRLVENAAKCVGFTAKPSVDEVFESDAEARRAVSAAL